MKRRIFAVFFVIYTISLNSPVHSSGYILFEKSGETVDNKSQNFLLDAKWTSSDESQEEQLAFDPVNDTHFLLYTSKNLNDPQTIEKDRQSLLNSNFDARNPVRVIIHGFRDSPNAIVATRGRNAYGIKGNFNVILVDWSKGADTINYMLAKQRIYQIGPIVAEFIEFILETYKDDKVLLSDFYLIGHSLGAHLAGVVGKSMKVGKIPVILGLDPAGPLFSIKDREKRLDVNDADYVEIIHTDRGLQGLGEPIGTADFYPNFGLKQPGCGSDFDGACSHQRAAMYWAESINSEKGFWSVPCVSYESIKNKTCIITEKPKITMGGEPSNKGKASGVYYLETASQSPFALGVL